MQTHNHTQHTHTPPPQALKPDEKVYTAVALGLVGTGRTPTEAKYDLMSKIRQTGEQ